MRQIRLLILPLLGVALFANETYRSYQGYSRSRSTCFWWGNVAALDSKPLDKTVAFEDEKAVTECGFQVQAFDRFGPRLSVFLLAMTALPAFIASLGLAHGMGKLGANEIPIFIVSTPVLIFMWYCFLGWAFQHWRTGRKSRNTALTAKN
jgi:hypothetical protein